MAIRGWGINWFSNATWNDWTQKKATNGVLWKGCLLSRGGGGRWGLQGLCHPSLWNFHHTSHLCTWKNITSNIRRSTTDTMSAYLQGSGIHTTISEITKQTNRIKRGTSDVPCGTHKKKYPRQKKSVWKRLGGGTWEHPTLPPPRGQTTPSCWPHKSSSLGCDTRGIDIQLVGCRAVHGRANT